MFYSLSIAFAIMISYASYLPKKTDVVNSAFLTATANHGYELFIAIGVFGIMGYMSVQQGVPVNEVAGSGGIGLAFMTFPTAISELPALNTVFGVIFFGTLFTAGVTSLISIFQAVIAGIQDKFDIEHKKATTLILVPSFLLSFLFITGAGLSILDIVDAFINQIGVALGGFIEVILIGWFFNIEKIRSYANEYSNFSVGKWWALCLKIVTVLVLGVMLILNTKTLVTEGYGKYEMFDIKVFGWGALALVFLAAALLTGLKGKGGYKDQPDEGVQLADEEV